MQFRFSTVRLDQPCNFGLERFQVRLQSDDVTLHWLDEGNHGFINFFDVRRAAFHNLYWLLRLSELIISVETRSVFWPMNDQNLADKQKLPFDWLERLSAFVVTLFSATLSLKYVYCGIFTGFYARKAQLKLKPCFQNKNWKQSWICVETKRYPFSLTTQNKEI